MTPAETVAAAYAQTNANLAERAAAVVMAQWAAQMGSAEPSTLREAANRWLSLAIPVVIRARQQSAQLGRGYFLAQRRLAAPDAAPFNPVSVSPANREQISTSLWVTGPEAYVNGKQDVATLLEEARVNAITGAVQRHTFSGGREVIGRSLDADPMALGYYRVEDSDPCYFCAALMSRGAVFKEDSFDTSDARFDDRDETTANAKVHDHCGGDLVPMYERVEWPGDTRQYGEMWKRFKFENSDDKGNALPDTLENWRRWYEANRAA